MSSIREAFLMIFVLGALSASCAAHAVQLSCDELEARTAQSLHVAAHGVLPREFKDLAVRDVCAHRARQLWAEVVFSPRQMGPFYGRPLRFSRRQGKQPLLNVVLMGANHWHLLETFWLTSTR